MKVLQIEQFSSIVTPRTRGFSAAVLQQATCFYTRQLARRTQLIKVSGTSGRRRSARERATAASAPLEDHRRADEHLNKAVAAAEGR